MKNLFSNTHAYPGVDPDYLGDGPLDPANLETGVDYLIHRPGDTVWTDLGATHGTRNERFTATAQAPAGTTGTVFRAHGMYERIVEIINTNANNTLDSDAFPQYKTHLTSRDPEQFLDDVIYDIAQLNNYYETDAVTGDMSREDIWKKPLVIGQIVDINNVTPVATVDNSSFSTWSSGIPGQGSPGPAIFSDNDPTLLANSNGAYNGDPVILSNFNGTAAELNGTTMYIEQDGDYDFRLYYNTQLTQPYVAVDPHTESVSAATDTGDPIRFWASDGAFNFFNGEQVLASNFTNDLAFLNGNTYFVKESYGAQGASIRLTTDRNLQNEVGLPVTWSGSLAGVDYNGWNGAVLIDIVNPQNTINDGDRFYLSNFSGMGDTYLNGAGDLYLKNYFNNTYEIYTDQALTTRVNTNNVLDVNDAVTLVTTPFYGGSGLTGSYSYPTGTKLFLDTPGYSNIMGGTELGTIFYSGGNTRIKFSDESGQHVTDFSNWLLKPKWHLKWDEITSPIKESLPVYTDQGTNLAHIDQAGWFAADDGGFPITPGKYWGLGVQPTNTNLNNGLPNTLGYNWFFEDSYNYYLQNDFNQTNGMDYLEVVDTGETINGEKLYYHEVNGIRIVDSIYGRSNPVPDTFTSTPYGSLNNNYWSYDIFNQFNAQTEIDTIATDIAARSYYQGDDFINIFICENISLVGTNGATILKFFQLFRRPSMNDPLVPGSTPNQPSDWEIGIRFYETLDDAKVGNYVDISNAELVPSPRGLPKMHTNLQPVNFETGLVDYETPPDELKTLMWPCRSEFSLYSPQFNASSNPDTRAFIIPKYLSATPQACAIEGDTGTYRMSTSPTASVGNLRVVANQLPTQSGDLNPLYERFYNNMLVNVNQDTYALVGSKDDTNPDVKNVTFDVNGSVSTVGIQGIYITLRETVTGVTGWPFDHLDTDSYWIYNSGGWQRDTIELAYDFTSGVPSTALCTMDFTTNYELPNWTPALPTTPTKYNYIDDQWLYQEAGWTYNRPNETTIKPLDLTFRIFPAFGGSNYDVYFNYTGTTGGTLDNQRPTWQASTSGTVSFQTVQPGVTDFEIIHGGNTAFTWQDANNQTQVGANISSDVWLSWETATSQLQSLPNISLSFDSNGYLTNLIQNADFLDPLADVTTVGKYMLLQLEQKPSLYVPETADLITQQDTFDTQTDWTLTTEGQKYWPTGDAPKYIWPNSAQIVLNQPSSVTQSISGIKYVRNSGFMRWGIELNYPPMLPEQFQQLWSAAQQARGQTIPFYLTLRQSSSIPNAKRLFDFNPLHNNSTVIIKDPVNVGESVITLEGLSNTSAISKGELIRIQNRNGWINTIVNDVSANVYGEVQIRLAYPTDFALTRGSFVDLDPEYAIVTLAEDGFEYTRDTAGLYYVKVKFDMDEWK